MVKFNLQINKDCVEGVFQCSVLLYLTKIHILPFSITANELLMRTETHEVQQDGWEANIRPRFAVMMTNTHWDGL